MASNFNKARSCSIVTRGHSRPSVVGLMNAETACSKHANFLQKKGQSSFINGDDYKSMKIGWTFFQTCQEP